MSLTSNASQKQIVPVSEKGFGSGYNFQYEKTIGNSWSPGSHKNGYHHFKPESDEFPYDKVGDDPSPRLIIPAPANDERDLSGYDRLAFATEVSIRYHNRRKQHYETAFRMMMLGVIVLAVGAFVFGAAEKTMLGLGVIGLAAATLVWNVTQKSREHDVLRSEYQTLLDQIRLTHVPDEKDLMNWRNLRLRIQSKEPAVYWAVANDCYYEVARAWDLKPEERGLPPIMLRPFMNWFRF